MCSVLRFLSHIFAENIDRSVVVMRIKKIYDDLRIDVSKWNDSGYRVPDFPCDLLSFSCSQKLSRLPVKPGGM